MSTIPKLTLALLLPAAAVFGFAVLTGVSMIRLNQVQSEMRISSTQNMLWVSSRAHVAHLRLSETLLALAMQQSSPEVLEQRLQTYLAAMHLLTDGPQARRMQELGFGAELVAIQAGVAQLEAMVRRALLGDDAAIAQARALLTQYETFLRSSDNRAMTAAWDEMGGKLDLARDQLQRVWMLMLGALLAGLVLIAALVLTSRKARTQADALERERQATEIYRNFAGIISHQFLTPLSITDSTLQRLARQGLTQEEGAFQARIRTARDAVARLVRLVERSLDVARLDAGQIKARGIQTDLAQLARDVAQREAMPDDILDWQLPKDLPPAYCDAGLTDIILSNLYANALRYRFEGGRITISAAAEPRQLRLSLSNPGAISATDAPRIFERYYRAETAKHSNGTGLGLFIARRLAELQGGTLRLSQTEGRVTFTLSLPRAAPEMQDD
ncbi:HAMP domain-containing sensor histidine kinase [Xinfangfangia sp. CPCC 101601]|uniref:histidine kinase n=1 Tax=Pseudogemmobacter lacusdianii TaxID=3069608 RepID=A0ABU0VUU2_9RHOB|nr:HAMP domain-containing sensor histidine kinase [Xinfangfangia sp. CPCC 101601]MDQ2065323.1 HAMP domain-containing sensor histidine kinase [Xinfangfangia sp. CPCC 101601]